MLTVRLDMAEIETKTLGDVQHVAEVKTYGVEQHRSHADFIQGPHVVATARVVRLPPAELHAEFASAGWEFDRHNPDEGRETVNRCECLQRDYL